MEKAPPNHARGRVRARARAIASTVRLRKGDVVSVAISTFGDPYARSRGAVPWTSAIVRDEGEVIGKKEWEAEALAKRALAMKRGAAKCGAKRTPKMMTVLTVLLCLLQWVLRNTMAGGQMVLGGSEAEMASTPLTSVLVVASQAGSYGLCLSR
eukprot:5333775-Pleurochrysis_carterae.AAC.2